MIIRLYWLTKIQCWSPWLEANYLLTRVMANCQFLAGVGSVANDTPNTNYMVSWHPVFGWSTSFVCILCVFVQPWRSTHRQMPLLTPRWSWQLRACQTTKVSSPKLSTMQKNMASKWKLKRGLHENLWLWDVWDSNYHWKAKNCLLRVRNKNISNCGI